VQTGTEKFKFEELSKEQFDALILSALKLPTDEILRARILQKRNQDGDQVRLDITDCVDTHHKGRLSSFR